MLVVESLEGWDATGLKALAAAATSVEPRAVVALFSATSPALVVIARGNDVGVDASAVLKSLVNRFGGKGGGKPDLAQGGGLVGDVGQMLATARQALSVGV